MFFVAEQSSATPYYYAMIEGKWKLVQVLREDLYSKTVDNLLFDIDGDPFEEVDLADEQPERVADMAESIGEWAARHPVSGQHVEIAPHPGWLPPRDWADVVIPADRMLPEADDGFGEDSAARLQQIYDGRASVIYE